MRYILTECKLPETLLTGASHKRFSALITRATAAGISWDYTFDSKRLEIRNAPAGLEGKLSEYGKVEVTDDATIPSD